MKHSTFWVIIFYVISIILIAIASMCRDRDTVLILSISSIGSIAIGSIISNFTQPKKITKYNKTNKEN